jgi:hypothetical protein
MGCKLNRRENFSGNLLRDAPVPAGGVCAPDFLAESASLGCFAGAVSAGGAAGFFCP